MIHFQSLELFFEPLSIVVSGNQLVRVTGSSWKLIILFAVQITLQQAMDRLSVPLSSQCFIYVLLSCCCPLCVCQNWSNTSAGTVYIYIQYIYIYTHQHIQPLNRSRKWNLPACPLTDRFAVATSVAQPGCSAEEWQRCPRWEAKGTDGSSWSWCAQRSRGCLWSRLP